MKVLITGHTGFLGNALAEHFQDEGHRVYGVSRSLRSPCGYIQYPMDVANKDALSQLVREKGIELIIHCAAKPIVSDCAADPFGAFMTNAMGTASILEAARTGNVAKTIVIETDKVYGLQEQIPTPETATLNPQSPYELSKAMGSELSDFYRDHYGMDVVSVRPVNLFGPGDYSFTRLVPNSMRAIKAGKAIEVHEHAINMYRDFLYIRDAVKMIHILATNQTMCKVYNLSSNQMMGILDVAIEITKALKHPLPPTIVGKPGDYAEISLQSIDGSRFIDEFGFVFTPFNRAIEETYQAYLEQSL